MANVVPLKFTAKLICIQTLLDLSGDGDREAAQRMLRQLQTGCYMAVSCGLLRRLVDRYPGKVTNNLLSALASTHLRELKLKRCKSVSFTGLKNVLETCPLVTKLDLSECDQFSQREVFHITSFLRPGITALSLENCLTVDNAVVQSILSYMKTLQHLNLSGCSKLTDNVFLLNEDLQLQREMFGKMSQDRYDCALVSVDISCTTLTSTAVRHLATLTGPTLKHVNISWTGADTLALLYLSGYGRPSIVDLTLSDADSVLDGPLKQSLLELKSTLSQLKMGMLRKERAKKGNYGDIPVNVDSSSDPHPEVTASLSSSDHHREVTASLSSINCRPEVVASTLSQIFTPETSAKLKQPQYLQNNDTLFKCEDNLGAGHLHSSDIGSGVATSELLPSVNFNGERPRSGDGRLTVKSFMDVLEEASDSSVDCTTEEEDSDAEGSVESDDILSAIRQANGINGHVEDVTDHSVGGSCAENLASDATVHLIGGSRDDQPCDEMILIGESDVDDLTSDVTVHVNDDSYSWTVDKSSCDTGDDKLSSNGNAWCEVCSKLKSNIAKCTYSSDKKTEQSEMSAASKLSRYTPTSGLSQDPQLRQLSQNSQTSEISQNSQISENSQNAQSSEKSLNSQTSESSQNSQTSEISQNSQTSESSQNSQTSESSQNSQTSESSQTSHINGFSQNIKTSDLTCSADSGIPQDMSQSVTLETENEPVSITSECCSGLANSREERVELNFIDDDTGMTYSIIENTKSTSIAKTLNIPTSEEEDMPLVSDEKVLPLDDAAVAQNEGVVLVTSSHGDGMTYYETVTQHMKSKNTKCDDVMISDETGVPLVMSCDEQGTYSESGVTCSESGVKCSESGVKCSESGVKCSESGVTCLESGVKCSESGVKCSESGVTCSESGVTCLESGVTYSESGVTCLESGVTCSESGVTCSESGVTCLESGVTCSESGVTCSESGVTCLESGVTCSESGVTCSQSGVACSESGACAGVQYLNCDNSLDSRTVKCDNKSYPAMLQSPCQTQEICDRSQLEPGAFFNLQKQSEADGSDGILNVVDSKSTETVMVISSSDLNEQGVQDACFSDKFNEGYKNLDDQDELDESLDDQDESDETDVKSSCEVQHTSQHASGYLDESGEYCYSANPANPQEQKPKPINSHKNSENGEIENSTEPHVYVQIYKPDLMSIDFKRIEFENTYKYSGLKCLKIFSAENKNLQKIKISWKDNLKSAMLEELAPLWPNINYISLIDCESLTSQSLVTLATRCKQIQTITLQGVTFIQDFAVLPFVNNGCLECLNLAECRITDDTLVKMAKRKMDRMKELDLSWCDDTSSVGLDKLFENTSDTLYKLSIRQLAANDKTLSLIASNFCHLTSLNMSSVDGIGDEAVVNLVENIRTLEHVDFSWNLGVSNRSISALLKNCQRLQRADLAGLKTITSEPFLPLISDLRQWRRCQALLRLKLHEKSTAAAAADAGSSSDEEYTDIYMPHRSTVYGTDLIYLNLEFCDQVSDNHLAEISIVCRRESLTIFNYYGELVKPELFIGQGRQWYSNYIPANDE